MSEAVRYRPFPRGALFGAAGLIGIAIVSASTARVTGVGTTRMPNATPIIERQLRFEDRTDGAVVVYEGRTAQVVEVVAPGTNGFLRGVIRGIVRARKREAIGADIPFTLIRWSDGRLSLEDSSTGQRVSLEAFGMTNAAVFAHLLAAPGAAP